MTTRIGDSNLVFGVTDEPWGYMQMEKLDHAPSFAEAQNGAGEVIAGEFFKDMKKCSGEYIYRNVSDSPVDAVGTNTTVTLTDVGLTVYILSASTVWQLGQWRKVTFEGVYYPNLGS